MRINNSLKILSFLLTTVISANTFAWDRSLEVGVGSSHDPNDSKYRNSGFMVFGDLYPLYRTPTTFWSINGGVGHWYNNGPRNKDLTTAAIDLALRIYTPPMFQTKPYFLGSFGPAYLTATKFGTNEQAHHMAFQTNLGLGTEFGDHYDASLRLVHYSNAGTGTPNQGYNILYFFSLGYLF